MFKNALLEGVAYDKNLYEAGAALYVSNCAFCHGAPGMDRGGGIPNLGYSPKPIIENLGTWLFNGPVKTNGMPDFTGKLDPTDVPKLQAFIQGTVDAIRPKK